MEPGLPPEDMPARVAELRQEADRAMSALRERVTAAREMQQQAMGATGTASSGDGRVTVVVDATGVVTSLTFAPSIFDATTPEKLAATVVATIQAAATKARAKVTEAMAPIRAQDEPARAAVAGIPELRGLRFGVPAVPTTATDPTALPDAGQEPARRVEPPAAENTADVLTERPW
jgi:DNA-binding protein YbaB